MPLPAWLPLARPCAPAGSRLWPAWRPPRLPGPQGPSAQCACGERQPGRQSRAKGTHSHTEQATTTRLPLAVQVVSNRVVCLHKRPGHATIGAIAQQPQTGSGSLTPCQGRSQALLQPLGTALTPQQQPQQHRPAAAAASAAAIQLAPTGMLSLPCL